MVFLRYITSLCCVVVVASTTSQAEAKKALLVPFQALSTITVIDVLDGDTVKIKEWDNSLRLASIDAPESKKSKRRPGQPFADVATIELKKMVAAGKTSAQCFDFDRYSRPLCALYVQFDGQSISINRQLVVKGLAWANTQDKRFLRDKAMLPLQASAKNDSRGLWGAPNPIAPWQWRRQCWEKQICQ